MARTLGAKNRTPREIRKDGEHQVKVAKLKEKNQKLRAERDALKKKSK